MPRVEVQTDVSKLDPEAPRDAEQQVQTVPAHDGGSATAPPARSARRATARRASNRRATARSRQADSEASIIGFVVQHPRSTAGDLAKGLNLDAGDVSTHLTKLAKAGEITKTSHGYSVTQSV
jgi:hypothetical protein